MRIAVTGVTGFIGKHIANRLAGSGHCVIAYGRRESPGELHPNAEYRRWDITESNTELEPAVDAVVHSAAHVDDWGRYEEFHKANVIGTKNVLDAFGSSNSFIHISSASVYERPIAGRPLEESDAVAGRAMNHYGVTKAIAENAVLQFKQRAIILRPRAVYGEGDTKLVPRLLRASKLGHVISVGNGQNQASITHVDNLAHAVECSLESQSARGVFNIADSSPVKMDELLSAIAVAAGLSPRVWYIPKNLAVSFTMFNEALLPIFRLPWQPVLTRYAVGQLSKDWILDISRARSLLGYRPERTYHDALPEITAKYRPDMVD